MDEKHILISLGDDKVKQIGEVIGNKTCNKILDLLTDSEMTSSEISKKLKIPLNTVDYNIKKLVKSGLIENASKWWSVKGKRINSYKVSNKKIIISPRKSLNNIFLLTAAVTGAIGFMVKKSLSKTLPHSPLIEEAMLSRATNDAVTFAMDKEIAEVAVQSISQPFLSTINPWTWFIIGAWLAIALFFILTIILERRNKK